MTTDQQAKGSKRYLNVMPFLQVCSYCTENQEPPVENALYFKYLLLPLDLLEDILSGIDVVSHEAHFIIELPLNAFFSCRHPS